MGNHFERWQPRSHETPGNWDQLKRILLQNRGFEPQFQLDYGDHGLQSVLEKVQQSIVANRRIALYADYDVDGTLSCVSWIWFFKAIGFQNYVHYIPCRFKEGYGLNLNAVKHLIDEEKAELIITMDTGITANEEAAYCKSRGVDFICTDHHKIQPEKMPDCLILNPKMHSDDNYRELCGCGITFVVLRKLGTRFSVPDSVWQDLLALAGMATICDVVPLNGVNHRLARLGVAALIRSERPVLKSLREQSLCEEKLNEWDVGFRLGPRINAVGRLEHADLVVKAFVDEDPRPLIENMSSLNLKRREIQKRIVEEAREQAQAAGDAPILFLGGDWHPGVVGIAASKIAEEFWRPVWLFQRGESQGKGSARSIEGFDVTDAMRAVGEKFKKFGGHRAAGGFSFDLVHEEAIREGLVRYATEIRNAHPELWRSQVRYDCELPSGFLTPALMDFLDDLRPFGNGFESPAFRVEGKLVGFQHYKDKITGQPLHTAYRVRTDTGRTQKVVFFHKVHPEPQVGSRLSFVVEPSRNEYQGEISLDLIGLDVSAVQ